MSGLSQRRGASRPRPAMNVTPLVDVVLVLLIIFMVVVPAVAQGVDVTVPSILHVDESSPDEVEPHLLSVTRAGGLYLDDAPIAEADLASHLMRASRTAPDKRLVIRADGQVPYALVRRIYRAAQQVAFPGVSLRVSQRHDEAAPAGEGG